MRSGTAVADDAFVKFSRGLVQRGGWLVSADNAGGPSTKTDSLDGSDTARPIGSS